MKNSTVIAIMNLNESPETLYVHGSIITYHPDDKIIISVAEPQGINPDYLLLDLKIIEGKGPMKGTPKKFYFHLSNCHKADYKQVTVLSIDTSTTVDIETLS